MLRHLLTLSLIGLILGLTMATSVEAQESKAAPSRLDPAAAIGVKPLTPEERKRYEALTQDMLKNYEAAMADPKTRDIGIKASRRADAIADASMAEEREKILRFLDIDPESEDALYVFVSWSMPLEMLRAYAIEAMWSGASLVFKGVPPGRTLMEFMTKDITKLVYGKGAAAAVLIDPRLYDSYEIKNVPTIVLTRNRNTIDCMGFGQRTVKEAGKSVAYDVCPPMDPSDYWKMSGAVTMDYALEQFKASGATDAQVFLNALKRGHPQGRAAGQKDQKPFEGEWQNVISPADVQAGKQGVDIVTAPLNKPAPKQQPRP
jgi:type-F conjugative transfer system pilin assembly protein TrbC